MKMQRLFGAIVLAAGKGKRMNSKTVNKVVLPLQNKPMISYTIDLLESLGIKDIIVVIGFAKESIVNILKGRVFFAEQKKRLGTAHAVLCGLKKIPLDISDVIILNGDDSAFYKKEVIEMLIQKHKSTKAVITLMTIKVKNSFSLGRIIRDENGRLVKIVEEKDTTENQKNINEVNPGCYIFSVSFLKKYIKYIKKNPISGEYYINNLIDLAVLNKERTEAVLVDNITWRGVNTKEELFEAEKLFMSQGVSYEK